MSYYISRYVGTGKHGDPYKPAIWGTALAPAIDLRPDPTLADGVAFCHCDLEVSGAGFTKVAEDKSEALSTLINRRLFQELLVSERTSRADLQDTIRDLLVNPPAGAWKPLQRARGVHEIWLGGLFWSDAPPLRPVHGTINDDFNRANETPVAAPWVELAGSGGDVNLSSNALTHSADGALFLYHNNGGLGWNADQSAQFLLTTLPTDNDWGPAVRVGSSGFSGYFYGLYNPSPSSARGPSKFVGGTYTNIEGSYAACTAGQTAKIDVTGSTLRCYINGAEDALSPATDTSLTTEGLGAGLFIFEDGGAIDDAVLTGEVSGGAGLPLTGREPRRRFFFRGTRR